MNHRLLPVLVLLGLVVGVPGVPSVAAQDQASIAIDIRAGYEGSYRVAEWFPVVVTVANDGPDIHGTLEWSFPGQREELVFRREIDLPRGSRKRVSLAVFAREFARNGRLRLLAGNRALAEQIVSLDPVDPTRFLIGVISSDPALLNSLNSLSIASTSGTTVRHLQLTDLPDQAAALRGLNALFLHNVDSAVLSPAQLSALDLWVRIGGQLVVSGGIGGQQAAAALQNILPVAVSGAVSQGDLAPLAVFGSGDAPPGAATALSDVQPRAGAEPLPPDAPLLYQWEYGAGAVTFSRFDLAGLRGWAGETRLWDQVLVPIAIFAPGTDARLQRINLLQNVLRLPALALPSTGLLLCFLVAYILTIGPLNYLVLRRLGRLEWAWLTVPLAVVVFAGGLYIVGFGLRGGRSQLNQVAVVQAFEGQSRGMATGFIGLFSPRRSTYRLAFPADTLVSEARSQSDMPNQQATVLTRDSAVEVPDVLVDVASVRTFMTEAPIEVPVRVQSDMRLVGGDVEGEILNAGSQALADALVVQGDTFQPIGSLAPGARRRVTLGGAPGNFPWGVNLPPAGPFDRQQLLAALFNNGAFRFGSFTSPGGPLDEQGVYLLAWSDQPAIPVRLDGDEAPQTGATLYVIRLETN
jgi:hypothetical protein